MNRLSKYPPHRSMQGLTLIELMIAMLIGLLVLGAAIAIFASNQQAYRTNENVGRMQETARTAFELMAMDIREAGGNACSRALPTANVLNSATSNWYSNWNTPIQGFEDNTAFSGAAFGTSTGSRVEGSDAITIMSTGSQGVTVTSSTPSAAELQLNTSNHGLKTGDLAIVCDSRQSAVFQVSSADTGSNATVMHDISSGTPGSCTRGLGLPMNCAAGVDYAFGPNSTIAKLHATAWFIGVNSRGGRSLYEMSPPSGAAIPVASEIVDGVSDMQITYLASGASQYATASTIGNWEEVTAVRVQLTITTPELVGTDGKALSREVSHVVMLRNRNS